MGKVDDEKRVKMVSSVTEVNQSPVTHWAES